MLDILYHTGYMGESLEGRNLFDDRILFGYLFCSWYLRHNRRHCFVATVQGRVVGYIVGAPDTRRHLSLFLQRYWRPITRRIYRLMRRRAIGTVRLALMVLESYIDEARLAAGNRLYDDYPAHLHINLLAGYQRHGIGARLMETFIQSLRDVGVHGLHCMTSNRHYKALPFYNRMGFVELSRVPGRFWPGVEDTYSVTFARKI